MFRAPCSVTMFSYLFYFKAFLKITSPLTTDWRVFYFLYSCCKSCTSSPETLCSSLDPIGGLFLVSFCTSFRTRRALETEEDEDVVRGGH